MDNFFMNMWRTQKREAAAQAKQETQVAQGGTYGSEAVYVRSEGGALSVSAWYRGLAVKADTFAQLVMQYQKQNDRIHGGNYEPYNRAEGKRLNYLIQVQPNPLMTATQLLRQAAIHREVHGNAVIYVERNGLGEIKALWLCSAASLNMVTMEYTIVYNRPGGPVSKTVDAEDVIHWRNTYTYDNGLTGVGTLVYAKDALTLAATNDKQALDIAAKGGKYKILLKEEQRPDFALNMLNKEQREGAAKSMQDALDKNLDVIAMNGLMDAQVISQDAQSQQLLETRKFDTQLVARFLGVPLVLLMDYTNNTYKAPEQAMQAFLQHTIAPMARDVEQEFNAKLVGPNAYPTLRYAFNDESLMRLDPKGRIEIAKIQLETGIKCVNELRAEYDLPAIGAEGDRHLVSTNLQPLDNLKVGKNQAGESPVTSKQEGGEE